MSGLSRRREGPSSTGTGGGGLPPKLTAADLLRRHASKARPEGEDAEEHRRELLERHRSKRGRPAEGGNEGGGI